jgi:cellulose 1,4-beta-cellobiosidase
VRFYLFRFITSWRWLEENGANCFTGNEWDCSSTSTCTACNLEGASYQQSYGITTSGSQLKLSFVTNSTSGM